jgi:hypothetical protein
MNAPTVGVSEFARTRNCAGGGYSHFDGSFEELVVLVAQHWSQREPGAGRSDLEKVVVVPLPCPERFRSTTVLVSEGTKLEAELTRRQPGEDPYVQLFATEGEPEPVRFAKVVLYSKAALLENDGVRSTDCEWEIVSLIASPVEDEPMAPLTMARNMLAMPGGTPTSYTAEEFARAIYHWSQRARLRKR